ncbi:bud emergence protein 1 [Malassezia sp. CBS 17886]|nr:bud emergence protein 1 [Malassezia sp. CBS 17886]
MKSLKELHMSLKDRSSGSSRSASAPAGGAKHADSLLPPKQVVRAIADYTSQSPCELNFHKGDFFHVISDNGQTRQPGWIEACNPITNARGLVPASHFDILARNSPPSAFSLAAMNELSPSGNTTPEGNRKSASAVSPTSAGLLFTILAHAKYNFVAERPQELDAKEGDNIIVVARANIEWVVAKHVGRLGAPGLIPIAFVAFYDASSGAPLLLSQEDSVLEQLPTLAEWEANNVRYRQNAIPLGRIDGNASPITAPAVSQLRRSAGGNARPWNRVSGARRSVEQNDYFSDLLHNDSPRSSGARTSQPGTPSTQDMAGTRPTQSMHLLPPGKMMTASVDTFHYEPNEYWFHLRVSYVTALTSSALPAVYQGHEHRDMALYRLYADFQTFHASLVHEFPSGNPASSSSTSPGFPTLPQAPQSLDENTVVPLSRALSEYMEQICSLSDPIPRSYVVRSFLELRPGDRCSTSVASAAGPPAIAAQTSADPAGRARMHSDAEEYSRSHDADSTGHLRSLRLSDESALDPANVSSSSIGHDRARFISGANGTSTPPYHRIKVTRCGDADQILALRMPPEFTWESLLAKVQERLGTDIQVLRLNDARNAPALRNSGDLREWMHASLMSKKKFLLHADIEHGPA